MYLRRPLSNNDVKPETSNPKLKPMSSTSKLRFFLQCAFSQVARKQKKPPSQCAGTLLEKLAAYNLADPIWSLKHEAIDSLNSRHLI